jgi:hypothetical protein
MRAEFYRPGKPEAIVGVAVWSKDGIGVSADEDAGQEALDRIFRRTPVAIDDPSLRSFGTAGPVMFGPGTLPWFRIVAQSRAQDEGLAVRLSPEGREAMGWDPAGAYRSFAASIERKERIGLPSPSNSERARQHGSRS